MSNPDQIKKYYSESWLPRFQIGHNANSLAMHMGYFSSEHIPNDEAKLEMNKFLVSHFPENKEELIIVDAGCGVGGTCKYLVENFQNVHVTGVNLHDLQIEFAKKNITKVQEKSSIQFLNESYLDMSFASDSVDVLFALESMCHAPSKSDFIHEVFRVLKPKGICLIFDYFVTKGNDMLSEQEKTLLRDFEKGWAVEHYPDDSFLETLQEVGFSQCEINSLTEKVQPGINHSYLKAIHAAKENSNPVFVEHLNANIALKKLVDLKVIDYKTIKLVK